MTAREDQLAALEDVLSRRLPKDLARWMVDRVDRMIRLTAIRDNLIGFKRDAEVIAADVCTRCPGQRLYYMVLSPRLAEEPPTRDLIWFRQNGLLAASLGYAHSISRFIHSIGTVGPGLRFRRSSSTSSDDRQDSDLSDDDTV